MTSASVFSSSATIAAWSRSCAALSRSIPFPGSIVARAPAAPHPAPPPASRGEGERAVRGSLPPRAEPARHADAPSPGRRHDLPAPGDGPAALVAAPRPPPRGSPRARRARVLPRRHGAQAPAHRARGPGDGSARGDGAAPRPCRERLLDRGLRARRRGTAHGARGRAGLRRGRPGPGRRRGARSLAPRRARQTEAAGDARRRDRPLRTVPGGAIVRAPGRDPRPPSPAPPRRAARPRGRAHGPGGRSPRRPPAREHRDGLRPRVPSRGLAPERELEALGEDGQPDREDVRRGAAAGRLDRPRPRPTRLVARRPLGLRARRRARGRARGRDPRSRSRGRLHDDGRGRGAPRAAARAHGQDGAPLGPRPRAARHERSDRGSARHESDPRRVPRHRARRPGEHARRRGPVEAPARRRRGAGASVLGRRHRPLRRSPEGARVKKRPEQVAALAHLAALALLWRHAAGGWPSLVALLLMLVPVPARRRRAQLLLGAGHVMAAIFGTLGEVVAAHRADSGGVGLAVALARGLVLAGAAGSRRNIAATGGAFVGAPVAVAVLCAASVAPGATITDVLCALTALGAAVAAAAIAHDERSVLAMAPA